MPPPLSFDLIKRMVEHGAQYAPGETVDPSTSPELTDAGVALVSIYIEQLSLCGIVGGATALFGEKGGMWIGYELTEQGRNLSESEVELRRAVAELIGGPRSEVSEAVVSLREECSRASINPNYRDDFLRTLEEIQICFDDECFNATIGLCGKIMEVCLKVLLIRNGVQFDPNSMMGPLLKMIHEKVPGEYVDPSLGHVANIVNASRITAVHAKEKIPVPSRDQAIMVVFAMRDAVRRNLSHVGPEV